jgi:hypothetical protein
MKIVEGSSRRSPDKEQPIQEEYQASMRVLAKVLDDYLNPDGEKKTGFALLVFPFGQPNGKHRANYISNARREDMLDSMREFIARNEGVI